MKACPECHKEYGDELGFCGACGVKLSDQQASSPSSSGINLGNKNVISGEVIGHKEDIRVSGNATIVKNEDQTREVKACGVCGKTKLILDGVFCRRCGAFVCEEHFERTTNQCLKCQRGMSSEAEQKYMTLLQEVMSDNRIDAQERQRLDEERKRLNLSEDRARELENNYKSSLSAQIDTLGRRERRRLEIAKQELLEDFKIEEALSVLAPLYERFRDNPEVRSLYLLALIEKAPDRALQLVQEMRFDDLDKSLAHIEVLARQRDFDQAADVIRQARRAYGEEHPILLARDAELSLEEYRHTKRPAMLDDARDCIEQLPPEIADPYVLVVKAYLAYTAGAQDALDLVADILREKKLPPFYLLRLRNRIGLANAGLVPSASAATSVSLNRDEKSTLPTNKLSETAAQVLSTDIQALEAGLLRGVTSSAYVKSVAEAHLAAWRDAAAIGIPEGQFLLGIALRDGAAIAEDREQAFSLIKDAAQADLAVAMVNLSMMYENGMGVEKNEVEAIKWCRKAAEQGYSQGQYNLGLMYISLSGVEQSDVEAVKLWRKSAEQGHAGAQVFLGYMYENGRGVEKSCVEAVKWYYKAAKQGYAEGQSNLGTMYRDGQGVEQSDTEAVEWYRKAAEQGDAVAQYYLARCYENGTGVEQSDTEAAKWYRKAAEQGDADAMRELAKMAPSKEEKINWYKMAIDKGDVGAKTQLAAYLSQLGVNHRDGINGAAKDDAVAVNYFREAAELGNPDAQVSLGWMYGNGKGVTQNNSEAVKWYKMAADQGHALGQGNLGIMYENGTGVPQDSNAAVKWYQLAADQGNDVAKKNLQRLTGKQHFQKGLAFRDGNGVAKDDSLAVAEFRKAAELDNADGQVNLGWMYEMGRGAEQSHVEAAKWYRKGAEQGDALGQSNLGLIYQYGKGVPLDCDEAVKWYRLSASQGNAWGQNNLGTMYEEGKGVPKDLTEARKWYEAAAAQGHEQAKKNLQRVHLASLQLDPKFKAALSAAVLEELELTKGIKNLKIKPNIPPKCQAAAESNCEPLRIWPPDTVLGVLDLTSFGPARECVLFEVERLYYNTDITAGSRRAGTQHGYIPYVELRTRKIECGSAGKGLDPKNTIVFGENDFVYVAWQDTRTDKILDLLHRIQNRIRAVLTEYGV